MTNNGVTVVSNTVQCKYDKDAIIDVPTQFLDLTTSIKDLIFVNTKDSESEADMEMLSYVDLTNDYESFGANENERAFNTSLWKVRNNGIWWSSL